MTTSPARLAPALPRGRCAAALAVSIAYVGILIANLCYPAPRGPADNGDFARVFLAFSDGPVGLPTFPAVSDPRHAERFFRFYHRYWRLTPPLPGAQETSSRLVFLPGRLLGLGAPPHTFDLNRNTLCVILVLGAGLLATLSTTRSWMALVSLTLIAALMSDAQVAMYLNSFYQESGAYVFTFAVVCLMHVLWERRGCAAAIAFTAAAILLARTKFPFTPSVVLVASSVLLAWIVAGAGDRRVRTVGLVLIAALAVAAASYFDRVRDRYGLDVSYNFIFQGALPQLAAADRPAFLSSIGIDPRFALLSGKNFYEPDSLGRTPPLSDTLGNHSHTRALARLALDHPRALLQLVARGFAGTGVYDVERGTGVGTRPADFARGSGFSLDAWSALRERLVRGASAYALVFALCCALLIHVRIAGARDWRLLHGCAAMGFWAGSAVQVLISILGHGPGDLNKHLWFGNLLFDLSLVFAISGLGYAVWQAPHPLERAQHASA